MVLLLLVHCLEAIVLLVNLKREVTSGVCPVQGAQKGLHEKKNLS